MNQDNFNIEAICKTKRRLADAVGSLVECSEVNDLQTYSANSTFLTVSIMKCNLPVEVKQEIYKLIDLHDLCLIALNLIALKQNWNRSLATKLKDWAVKISQMTVYTDDSREGSIKDSMDEWLPNAEVKDSYRVASLYALALKWLPIDVFRAGLPVAFSHTIQMINANEYFDPIDTHLDTANLDALYRQFQAHLLQIQAELREVLVC